MIGPTVKALNEATIIPMQSAVNPDKTIIIQNLIPLT